MRSLLIVRADEFPATMAAGTDAIIVDFADDPDPAILGAVREVLQAAAVNEMRPLVFIRLAAVHGGGTDAVLASLMPAEPDGFVISCANGADVQHLGAKLAVHEAEHDLADNQTGIVAEIGTYTRSVLHLDSFVDCSPRLLALAWNLAAFAAELELDDDAAAPSTIARGLVVIAARAAGVAAITFGSDGQDESLRHHSIQARRDGFNAMVAHRPDQLPIIAEAFGS